jgi:two-component system, NarL family, response regulator NreC
MMAVKILIADDHKIVREGLCAMFEKESEMEVIGEAEDGVSAVKLACKLRPDVIILDVNMPEMDGIDATRRLSKELPDTKIIALSMFSKRTFIKKMLEAGASGYVLKGGAFTELLEAVNTVLADEVYLCAPVATVLVDDYVDRTGKSAGSSVCQLTDRELDILKLLAEGKPSKEIAQLLDISIQAVDANRRRMMQKLGIESFAELVKYAIRQGLASIDD